MAARFTLEEILDEIFNGATDHTHEKLAEWACDCGHSIRCTQYALLAYIAWQLSLLTKEK